MAREIKGQIFALKEQGGYVHFVECSSLQDLYNYVVEGWLQKGYLIANIKKINSDGSTPKVALYTNEDFKLVKAQHENFEYALKVLRDNGYHYEVISPTHALVYYKDKTGEYTFLETCDDKRHGWVCIEGRAQIIDDWVRGN